MRRTLKRRKQRDRPDAGLLARVPAPLRPLIGAAALVGLTRLVDRTVARSSHAATTEPEAAAATDAAPAVIRDRLLRVVLMTGALALARRAGLAMPRRDRS